MTTKTEKSVRKTRTIPFIWHQFKLLLPLFHIQFQWSKQQQNTNFSFSLFRSFALFSLVNSLLSFAASKWKWFSFRPFSVLFCSHFSCCPSPIGGHVCRYAWNVKPISCIVPLLIKHLVRIQQSKRHSSYYRPNKPNYLFSFCFHANVANIERNNAELSEIALTTNPDGLIFDASWTSKRQKEIYAFLYVYVRVFNCARSYIHFIRYCNQKTCLFSSLVFC